MAVAFSTAAEATVQRKVVHDSTIYQDLPQNTAEFFELDKCCEWICDGQYKKIALQFSDGHLPYSATVSRSLSQRTQADVFILADTSYGSCCVDEVAALHYQADAIIHFGHSCLSPSDRLPVLSVYGRSPLDTELCARKFTDLIPDNSRIALVSTVDYHHAMVHLQQHLLKHYSCVILANLDLNCQIKNLTCAQTRVEQNTDEESKSQPGSTHIDLRITEAQSQTDTEKGVFELFGRRFNLPEGSDIKDFSVFYVGEETMFLTNLMLSCRETTFYSYSPRNGLCHQQSVGVNKLLMRRFYLVEKVKDSHVVGILVATLSVVKYMDIVNRLKSLLSHAAKKYYVFSVGKVNVAKLANFPDVDVFVLVSCPESIILDSSEYYSPIVTPYEVELACNPDRAWTGDVVLDYSKLLPGGGAFQEVDFGTSMSSTDVSLISGRMRQLGVSETADSSMDSGAVTARDPMALTAVSGELFSKHSWQGLDQKLGQTEVTKAVQGRKGIAIQYEEEPS